MIRLPFSLVLLLIAVNCDEDPCKTTNVLNDWQRSTAFETDTLPFCDNFLLEGWYRVTSGAGQLMPTECPVGGFRCNTDQPIYLSNDGLALGEDVYPSVGNTVNRTAYAANFDGNCRYRSYSIKIKNCGGYFVYHLVPVSGGCSSAYCFGDQLPCENGTQSQTGFTPGCKTHPDVIVSPYVNVSLYETKGKNAFNVNMVYSRASFECHADDLQDGLTYTIRWYVNDIEMKNAKVEGLSKSDVQAGHGRMLEEHWTSEFKPNMLVKCSMQVGGNGFSSVSPQHYSDNYFAGLKVDQTLNYIVAESEELKIPIQLTMPLSCSWPESYSEVKKTYIKNNVCLLVLLTGIPSYQTDNTNCVNGISKDGIIFKSERCGIKFSHANWNRNQYIEITGQVDQLVNIQDRIAFLRLYNSDEVKPIDDLTYWKNINLPDIKILVQDKDNETLGAICSSRNDPHMKTCDQSKWELNLRVGLTEGEYIMYMHDRLPLQVNAYFLRCKENSTVLCNCGIAVRSANSIFVANFCETKYQGERKVNRYMMQKLCDDQSLIIEKTSTSYTITLPTGTKVFFRYQSSGIDAIYITPSILDANLTKGLCGIYNGDQRDDFMPRTGRIAVNSVKAFAESWQVKGAFADDTLFDPDGKIKPTEYFGQQYCSCVSTNNQFPYGSPIFNCNLTAAMETCRNSKTTDGVFTASCTTRTKRSTKSLTKRSTTSLTVEIEEDEKPPSFPIIPDESSPTLMTEEWQNGWTEELAREHCTTKFTSAPAYNVCTEYAPHVDTELYISDCISDIKSTGGDDWLKVTIQNYASECVLEASKMEILTVTNSTNTTGSEKPILSIIKESTCPENCSGNGICSEGQCQCFPGFYGELCSIVLSQAPYVEKDAFDGLCDSKTKPCKTFVIPGKDFVKESSLMCMFASFSLKSIGTTATVVEGDTFSHVGTYSSSFLMYCKLPESRKKRSIQFDVIATGYRISVSNNGKNYSEPLTTLIYDSLCYECNITSMMCKQKDSCLTKASDAQEDSKKTLWVCVSVAAAVFIIILLAIGICIWKHLRPKKSCVEDSTLSLPNISIPSLTHLKHERKFLSEPYRSKSDLEAHKYGW